MGRDARQAERSKPPLSCVARSVARRRYYDAAATREAPRWSAVDVAFEAKLRAPVSLLQLRAAAAAGDAAIAGMEVLTRPRLSVQRVSAEAWERVLALGGGTA